MEREVPLYELLENVPENARLVIDSEDGMSTSFIPVGLYCKRAAEALRQALAQPEQRPANFYLSPPPKREWVGLTWSEIMKLIVDVYGKEYKSYEEKINPILEILKNAEAKLKEKNS